jgi:Zn-dependent protease/CBS domain-containing protein
MFRTRWRLCRLLGIPIYLDASWLIILALLTFTLSRVFPALMENQFPDSAPALGPLAYAVMGLTAALTFFGCILLHELGHAAAARSQDVPMRSITLFLFGGVAETGDEPRSAKAELLVAIAGPAVSVVLAVLFGFLAWVGSAVGWTPAVVVVLDYLAVINMIVLGFNLLPAFPLDGGRVLRATLWGVTGSLRRATWWAALGGNLFATVLLIWGVVQLLGGSLIGGLWTCLIGFYLRDAARSSYQHVLIKQALEGEAVRRFMTPDPFVVPPALDLRTWVEDFVYRRRHKGFPVVSEGRLEGYIETDVLAEVPRDEWDRHAVGEVMRKDLAPLIIGPDADALAALEQMQRAGASRLLVTEGDRLVGIISHKDLMGFLALKLELEPEGADESVPRRAAKEAPSSARKPETLVRS